MNTTKQTERPDLPTCNTHNKPSASRLRRASTMSKQHNDPEYRKNRTVILREQPTCTVCNRAPSTQVDHITPIDAGGGHNPENLRGICAKCNNTLGHKYVTQRNNTRNTIRADALKDNGIQIQTTKPKRFFTEKNLF